MLGPHARHPAIDRLLEMFRSTAVAQVDLRRASRAIGMSQSHLQHLLRRQMGKTFTQLSREVRVQRAWSLMSASPHLTIEEVAEAAGYSTKTMCRHFKDVFGRTPSDCRFGGRPSSREVQSSQDADGVRSVFE